MDDAEYEFIKAELLTLFAEQLNIEIQSENTDLEGILDSQKFVELLLLIEQNFSVQMLVEDFQVENFRCIAKIASLILQHKSP